VKRTVGPDVVVKKHRDQQLADLSARAGRELSVEYR
jgi:hypothetical protein